MIPLAYAALWFFVFSVPWETVLVISGIGVISKLTGMLALGVSLFAVVVSGRIRRPQAFHMAALLFLIWTGTCVMILHLPIIPKKFWTFVQLFLVIWMIWELAPSRERVLGLMTAYVLGAFVASVDTIMVFRSKAAILRRYASGGGDANDVAMILALALPMAWYLGMMSPKPYVRLACRAYLPVALLALGLTGSRGGMLASMVGLLIVPLTMTRLSPGKLVTAIAILCLSGGLAVVYVPQKLVARFATTSSEVEGGRIGGRFKLWVAGSRAFAIRPLMGYGVSGFKSAVGPYLVSEAQVAHNSFVSVLVEEGLVGFLLYLSMLIAVFRAILRLPPLERRFGLVVFATLIVAMLPLTWEDRKVVWVILASLLGLAQAQDGGWGRALWQPQPDEATYLAGVTRAAPREPLTAVVRNAGRRPTA
jgi:O-antigen ligase